VKEVRVVIGGQRKPLRFITKEKRERGMSRKKRKESRYWWGKGRKVNLLQRRGRAGGRRKKRLAVSNLGLSTEVSWGWRGEKKDGARNGDPLGLLGGGI